MYNLVMAAVNIQNSEPPISREVKFHGYSLTLFSSPDDTKILEFAKEQPAGTSRYTTVEEDGKVYRYENDHLLIATRGGGRVVGFIGFQGQLRGSYMAVFKSRHDTIRNPEEYQDATPAQILLAQFEVIESPNWSGLIVVARDGNGYDTVRNGEMFGLYLNLMHSNWKE